MKCIFRIDGIAYLSQTKREAISFIDFWRDRRFGEQFFPAIQYPRRFKTTWRFAHIERAPSYGQFERINFDKVDYS